MIWLYRFRLVCIVLNALIVGTHVNNASDPWVWLSLVCIVVLVAQLWTPETK